MKLLLLFIRERFAWVGFFIFIMVLLNMLFSLDVGLNDISIWYVNVSLLVSFVLFLAWRYVIEVGKLKDFLGNMDSRLDDAHKSSLSLSPFQEVYFRKIEDVFHEKNMDLNQAKVQLQEYSDELLAWVHEVKAPLTAINLMVEHVEDLPTRRKLENEWLRLHLLVDQQLHQTRLASIEKDNYLTEIELKSVVYKEIRGMQAWCIEKGIGFEVNDLTETVMTDGKWLAFIVRQILSNAIKYSPANSEVTIFTELDPTNAILLHIKDVGIGIPLEDLPRIFQKSYTGTAGRESSQSTGMGLYLAYNVARKIGIRIYVQSTVGEGSLFTLRFPLQNEYVKLTGR
ncbi:sensor histidine kinase [Lysinibacillus cavernae]|uniref:sensor histidine kinase n=1 Tax=Lysinibacillus cavernae TaxID=2666135 RepID=UPI001E4C24DE|nr:sensor histidine kinase [Lysinibacillus cavernae]